MDKIFVIYWSQSGNTEAMAEAVGRGITAAGKEAVLTRAEDASVADLADAKCYAMGCPAMGAEVLEESVMDPFVTEAEAVSGGKTVALFGSYGWGDGQWMRSWEKDCDDAGLNLVCESVVCAEAPDETALEACRALGKALAA